MALKIGLKCKKLISDEKSHPVTSQNIFIFYLSQLPDSCYSLVESLIDGIEQLEGFRAVRETVYLPKTYP